VPERRLTKRPQAHLTERENRSAAAADRSARAAVTSARTGLVGVLVGLLVGISSVLGSILVEHLSAADTSLATLNQHRRDTYERYAADLAQLNEVLWANVYWTDDVPSPSQSNEFSTRAQPISASLGGDEAAIKVISSQKIWDANENPDTPGRLTTVHLAWNAMLKNFKCGSRLQAKGDCPNNTLPLTRAEITAKLSTDSTSVDSALKDFLEAARTETGSNGR
jgi:hypothetical protein